MPRGGGEPRRKGTVAGRQPDPEQGPGGAAEAASFVTTLPDGSRVFVRPIRPDDAWRLREGFAQLSPRSRYLRFHTGLDRLSDAQLRYLTEVDGVDHAAWVVLPLEQEDRDTPGMAVARYVRLADDPEVAEAAITVLDRFQGRGLGTLLLRTLAHTAVEAGISTFRNYVLTENTAMMAAFRRLGAVVVQVDGEVARIDLPLEDLVGDLADHESTTRRVLRSAARRDLGSLPLVNIPLWRHPGETAPTMKWRRPVVPDPPVDDHGDPG